VFNRDLPSFNREVASYVVFNRDLPSYVTFTVRCVCWRWLCALYALFLPWIALDLASYWISWHVSVGHSVKNPHYMYILSAELTTTLGNEGCTLTASNCGPLRKWMSSIDTLFTPVRKWALHIDTLFTHVAKGFHGNQREIAIKAFSCYSYKLLKLHKRTTVLQVL